MLEILPNNTGDWVTDLSGVRELKGTVFLTAVGIVTRRRPDSLVEYKKELLLMKY